VKFFQIKKLWLVASLQFVNLIFFWYVSFRFAFYFESCSSSESNVTSAVEYDEAEC
jgi:hypothetical protein